MFDFYMVYCIRVERQVPYFNLMFVLLLNRQH